MFSQDFCLLIHLIYIIHPYSLCFYTLSFQIIIIGFSLNILLRSNKDTFKKKTKITREWTNGSTFAAMTSLPLTGFDRKERVLCVTRGDVETHHRA